MILTASEIPTIVGTDVARPLLLSNVVVVDLALPHLPMRGYRRWKRKNWKVN